MRGNAGGTRAMFESAIETRALALLDHSGDRASGITSASVGHSERIYPWRPVFSADWMKSAKPEPESPSVFELTRAQGIAATSSACRFGRAAAPGRCRQSDAVNSAKAPRWTYWRHCRTATELPRQHLVGTADEASVHGHRSVRHPSSRRRQAASGGTPSEQPSAAVIVEPNPRCRGAGDRKWKSLPARAAADRTSSRLISREVDMTMTRKPRDAVWEALAGGAAGRAAQWSSAYDYLGQLIIRHDDAIGQRSNQREITRTAGERCRNGSTASL
jgi:hypothetical protein